MRTATLFVLLVCISFYYQHAASPSDPASRTTTPTARFSTPFADDKARYSPAKGASASDNTSWQSKDCSKPNFEPAGVETRLGDAIRIQLERSHSAWPFDLNSAPCRNVGNPLGHCEEAGLVGVTYKQATLRRPTLPTTIADIPVDYTAASGRDGGPQKGTMVDVQSEGWDQSQLAKRQPVSPLSDQQHLDIVHRLVATYDQIFRGIDQALEMMEDGIWQCHEATMSLPCRSLELALGDIPGPERARRLRDLHDTTRRHEAEYQKLGLGHVAIADQLVKIAMDLDGLERWRHRLAPLLRSLLIPYKRRCVHQGMAATSGAMACHNHANMMRLSAQGLSEEHERHEREPPVLAALQQARSSERHHSPRHQKRHTIQKGRAPQVDRRLDELIRDLQAREDRQVLEMDIADRGLKNQEAAAAKDFPPGFRGSRSKVSSEKLTSMLTRLTQIEQDYQRAELQITEKLLPRCRQARNHIFLHVELSASLRPWRRVEPLCGRARANLAHCQRQRGEVYALRRRLSKLRQHIGSTQGGSRTMRTRLRKRDVPEEAPTPAPPRVVREIAEAPDNPRHVKRSLPPHPDRARVQREEAVANVHRAIDRIEMRIWMTERAHASTDMRFAELVHAAEQFPHYRPQLSAARYSQERGRFSREFTSLGNEFGVGVRNADAIVSRCGSLRGDIARSESHAQRLCLPRLHALEERAAVSARQRLNLARRAAQRIVSPVPTNRRRLPPLAGQQNGGSPQSLARSSSSSGSSSLKEELSHRRLHKRHDEPAPLSPLRRPTSPQTPARLEHPIPNEHLLSEHSVRRLKKALDARGKVASDLTAQMARLLNEERSVLLRAVRLTRARLRALPDAEQQQRAQHVAYLSLARRFQRLQKSCRLAVLKDTEVLGELGAWLRHEARAQPALDHATGVIDGQHDRLSETMVRSEQKKKQFERLAEAVWEDVRANHPPMAGPR